MVHGNAKFLLTGIVMILGVLVQSCVGTGAAAKRSSDAAQYNAQLGAEYLNQNELEQARDKLEKALLQDRRNALAHATYGQLQYRVENPEKARVHFKKAISYEPDNADHRNNFGVFLCQMGEYEAAEAQFKSAVSNKFYKTPEYALDNAGVCMLDANRLGEADTYLRKALQTNPQFANAYLHMAELLFKRKRLTVADAYYQRFNTYGRETAESLLLGIQIARDSGRMALAQSLASKLLNDHPNSREAGEFLSRPQ